jgi:hypothetical protein
MKPPIPYDPSVEHFEEDEKQTMADIDATMARIREKTYVDSGHALRSVHAKSHGVLRGELDVPVGLPAELAQGLFRRAGRYPVVMRFSTIPGDLLDDKVSTPRGLAIKVVGVAGGRLPGSEDEVTQDFVLVNGPAFNAPNAKKFLSGLKQLAPTTDKAEGAKKALSAALQAAEKLVEAFGGKSAKLLSLGGHPQTNVLGETYYSQAPLRHGHFMGKFAVTPASAALQALKGAPVDLDGRPDGLRQAVVDFLARNGADWDLQVQLCTDLEAMPIEDSSVAWSEALSPFVTLGRIHAEPQQAWSAARIAAVDDGMSFSPWHGLAEHQPLGSIMRVRKMAYERSARFRAEGNSRRIDEPKSLADFPD